MTNVVEPLALLARADVVTPTALNLPGTVTDDEFRALCRWLGGLRDWSAWAGGDAIRYAESISEDLAAEVVEYLGRAKSTCIKWAWLASQYPPDERVAGVSPTHHEIVAKLPDRLDLLQQARDQGWSVEEFRGVIEFTAKQEAACTCRPDAACPKHGTVDV